jgi:hypothetical protein
MTYLLDVNALVALALLDHEFHGRVTQWLQAQRAPRLATSPITELGFVRVLTQASAYALTIVEAQTMLQRLKGSKLLPFSFIADDHDASQLPSWAKTPKQTTDGHLARLAAAHGAILATLDSKIPGAEFIPA